MDGFGPITNTRSLEGSVITALEQLDGVPACARVEELRKRGVTYRDILASWELMPPQPVEQADTVSKVLHLLGEIMEHVSNPAPGHTPRPPQSSPPRNTPTHRASSAPSAFATPESKGGGRRALPRRDTRTNKRQASVGRIELDLVLGGTYSKADVLFPFRRPWEKLPGVPGGVARRLHDDGLTGEQHLIVRLVEGAQLGEHRQDGAEVIYILSGGLRLGDETIFAGAVVRTYSGNLCPALISIGETELFVIGSFRDELREEGAVAPLMLDTL